MPPERLTAAEFQKKYGPNRVRTLGDEQPSKYHARKASFKGKVYHSQQECGDAMWLHDLLAKKRIADLKEQFLVKIYDERVGSIWEWKCDFLVELLDGREKLVETKGFATRDWRILKKLTDLFYPIPLLVNPNEKELLR